MADKAYTRREDSMMDANEALRMLRQAIATLRLAAEGDSNDAEIEAGQEVADAAEALDEWLSRGGLLPAAWGMRTGATVRNLNGESGTIIRLHAGGTIARVQLPDRRDGTVRIVDIGTVQLTLIDSIGRLS